MDVRLLLLCFSLLSLGAKAKQSSPNIIFILADDYGYNDIGYHGSEIKTPKLDELAAEGVKLENYYVQQICTPTRSALLTGRYPIHTGLQHRNIRKAQPNCVPLEDTIISQKLKQQGYNTHVIGKWHAGFYKKECTPTYRGFDSFFGFLTGGEDYYSHIGSNGYPGKFPFTKWRGYDLRRNESVSRKEKGQYSTHIFTKEAQSIVKNHNKKAPLFLYLAYQAVHTPMEVPKRYLRQYWYIKSKRRRIYAGMVSALDEAVGNLTKTLKESGLWDNTVLVFSTDNGGQANKGGNNWPLRGRKGTLWEAGVHGVGFVNSPLLEKPGRVSHAMIHVTDWFPTFVKLAGGDLDGTRPLDGYDVWESISGGKASPRTEILHNIDPRRAKDLYKSAKGAWFGHRAALRVGDWKLIVGYPGDPKWYPLQSSSYILNDRRNLKSTENNMYLFNIANDPEERHELSAQYPGIVSELLSRLEVYNSTAVPIRYPPPDLLANPALHGGCWSPWQDDDVIKV